MAKNVQNHHDGHHHVDYESIASTSKFKELLASKKRFIVPGTIFFLVFYFALPILTSYTDVLNTKAIGDISWAWVFAFLQFIMTWILCTIYVKKAAKFDHLADEIITENIEKGERGA